MDTAGQAQHAADDALRGAINALPRALRTLHKALVDVETQYFGTVGSPLEHVQLLANHPHFAWLQVLSAMMAELDEWLDAVADGKAALTVDSAANWRAAIEALVGPGAPVPPQFRQKYTPLLHDSPDVAIAHGALRAALAALPHKAG